jgi:RNAse (barnase) inhibitor barstar
MKKVKRIRVTSAQRREWLLRHDEGAEPQDIAKEVGFDTRTVKKAIHHAQQQREFIEARSHVLRTALEKHYDDISQFAKDLKAAFYLPTSFRSGPGGLDDYLQQNPLMAALREHLPRALLWKHIAAWDNAKEAYVQSVHSLSDRISKELNKSTTFRKDISKKEVDELCKLVDDDFGFHFLAIYRGEKGLVTTESKHSDTGIAFRKSDLTRLPEDKQGWLNKLIVNAQNWDETKAFQQAVERLGRAQEGISQELDTIALRRVVAGKCKYCPF